MRGRTTESLNCTWLTACLFLTHLAARFPLNFGKDPLCLSAKALIPLGSPYCTTPHLCAAERSLFIRIGTQFGWN
jgi:hypothetical protein